MANSVDLVIGSEAIKQVENLISKLSLADAELLKISQSATAASKGINGISTPSGLDKAVTNTANLNAELERQNKIIIDLTNKLDALAKKRGEEDNSAKKYLKTLEQETKNRQALQAQKEKAIKQSEREQAITEKNASAYNKTQTQINNLTKVYNDLALRKERYNNLSANEEMRLNTLGKVTEKYNGILKATDATIGKNQRNVGNYASGYNALGNSINQLTREAPAFANSMQTGFMALSNNYAALFDAINGIRDKNKALAAEGQPTVSLFKSLASSVFGWQTLLSVGITLLTLYGSKLIEWASAAMKGSDGIRTLKENKMALNEAIKTGDKEANNEIYKLGILYKTTQDVTLSIAQREKAVNKLQEMYPSYFGNIKDEIILNGGAKKSYEELKEAVLASSRAKAISGQMDKMAAEEFEKEAEIRVKIEEKMTEASKRQKTLLETEKTGSPAQIARARAFYQSSINDIRAYNLEILKLQNDLSSQSDIFLKAKEVNEEKAAKLEADRIKEPKGKKAAQAKVKREDLDYLGSYIKPVGTIVDEINKEISRLTTEKIIASPEDLPEINDQLKTLIKLKKELQGGSPTGGALPDFVVLDNTPAQTKLKNDWKDTFDSIADSAQQAGDIMAEFSQRNFDNEYRRLEAQKDISLKFAGESDEAKKKIEEDYEKRRKEIANRENKAKQRQAIFNIAIDTAQAIMKNYGQAGFIGGTAMAVITAALGAAQIAMVLSQKIPEYFAGTDNHAGGLMLVNDGGGSNFQEKVILPNGKEIMPEGRNVLMNAPKGTKVLTHEQQIREMLNERGISMSKSYQSNGMTAQEMDGVMSKHFAKIQVNNTTFDKKGFSSWAESNGNRTKQNANRVSRTGFKV